MTHPESVMTALQVLELREQLEGKGEDSSNGIDMEDEEKALLREMCNVNKLFLNLEFNSLIFLQFFRWSGEN